MVSLTGAFVLCVFVGIGLWVKNLATKDLLEQKIEESINSEVSIGGVEVSIFNFPAKVVKKGGPEVGLGGSGPRFGVRRSIWGVRRVKIWQNWSKFGQNLVKN